MQKVSETRSQWGVGMADVRYGCTVLYSVERSSVREP